MDTWVFLGWYYHLDGQRIGPVPNREIERLLDLGKLQLWDEVLKAWQDGDTTHFYRSEARIAAGHRGRSSSSV